MKNVEIIPAILTRDYADLAEKIELIRGMTKSIQIDVADGQFTPEPSWPYRKHDYSFEQILKEEKGLPGWEDFDFEIDLLANKPEEKVGDWIAAGASRVVLHVESKGNLDEAINSLSNIVEIGMGINIETPIESLSPYFDRINFIQCMGIDHVGYQGQQFDEKVLSKIKAIAKLTDLPISVDGGVNLENAASLIEAGASRLIIGSAIFESDNPIEAIQKFKRVHRG